MSPEGACLGRILGLHCSLNPQLPAHACFTLRMLHTAHAYTTLQTHECSAQTREDDCLLKAALSLLYTEFPALAEACCINYRKQRVLDFPTIGPQYISSKLVCLSLALPYNVWFLKWLGCWLEFRLKKNCEFWLVIRKEFPHVWEMALNIIMSFSTIYLHEAIFST